MLRRTPLKRTPMKKYRPTLRKGEPTPAEKTEARQLCFERAGGRCEDCGRPTPWHSGHLHHERAKRRWGWLESEHQRHLWLCADDHAKAHNSNGKPCPPKEKPPAVS